MKRILATMFLLIAATAIMAQAPQKFTYQAVVRDASNNLVKNHEVGVRISIIQGEVTGTAAYTEIQTTVTNANGLMTLQIGGGSVLNGNITNINWAEGPYFLKTETDPTGGTNYTVEGTQQLLSVPYALYAATSANSFSGDYNDLTNKPTIPAAQVNADWNATEGAAQILNKPTKVSAFTNDAGYITKDSIPSTSTIPTKISAFENDKGYLTSYTETDPTISAWAKEANKPQYNYSEIKNTPTLATVATTGNYNDLQNTPTIPTVPTNVGAFTNDKGYLTTETDPTISAWAKATNKPTYNYSEIKNTPTIPTVPTKVSAFENDAHYLTSYTETDPTISAWAKEANKPQYDYSEIKNTPSLATVATTGNYNDLKNTPTIPTVPTNVGAFTNDKGYLTTETDPTISAWAKQANKPQYDYSEIKNTPTIPTVPTKVSAFENDSHYLTSFTEQQILSISNDTLFLTGGSFVKLPAQPTKLSELTNDMNFLTEADVQEAANIPTKVSAFENDAHYLTSYTETDPTISAWAKAANKPSYNYSEIQNKPTFATVATSGNYNDLQNTPTIPTIPTSNSAFTNDEGYLTTETDPTISAWAKAANKPSYNYSEIQNKPTLATVATSGNYNDLQNTPTIPTVPTSNSAFTNDEGYLTTETDPTISAWAKEANKPQYDYSEIKNTPTIPTVPTKVSTFENDAHYLTSYTETDPTISAWAKATNKPSYNYSEIQNKPTFATVATTGNYNDLQNRPQIPQIPTNVSAFNNDKGYLVAADIQTMQADIASLQDLRDELNEMADSVRILKQNLTTLSQLVNTLNIKMEQEIFVTTAGQTTFTLQHEPNPTCIIRCYVNGVMAGSDRNGVLNINNNNPKQINYTATNNHNYVLKANDKVTFVYWY